MPDILRILVEERDRMERAISALQGTAPRRGRPPSRQGPGRPPGTGKKAAKKVERRRRGMSAAQRKVASERMRAYWATRKKKAKAAKKGA
jgi:hypothetical protein